MTTLREAALAALALVNDTLLERTVDTKRLSAVGRDLEDALDAEHAQPVAEFHAHPADWQYNITLLPGVPMLLDGTKLYLAPQPPADVPVYPNCPHAHECVDGGRYGKGAYEDLMNNAMGGKPWGECLCGIGDDGKPKYQQPPADVPRLSDEDKDELAGAYLNASPAKRHLGALIEAVEAEVRRRCGVVG